MDLKKLVLLVSQCQPLWDRNHEKFRDQGYKSSLWSKIGTELNSTDVSCKEAYKALREKYIREREKLQQYGNYYKPWDLLQHLQFLDPYINTRKSSNAPVQHFEEYIEIKQDPSIDPDTYLHEDVDYKDTYNNIDDTSSKYCKTLIKMVHQSRALWDRNYKDYNDKQMKDKLWMAIANRLKSDVTTCSLKWKSLREKYIRQKQKYVEGEHKWEFLDDLAFLDSVILYRKKQWKLDESFGIYPISDNGCSLSQSNLDYEITDECTNDSILNQVPNTAQTTTNKHTASPTLPLHTPDSSTLEFANKTERKRTFSEVSETSCHKPKKNFASQERTPEQIFGEFVAVMLAAKPDNERKIAMMEIMSVLTKPGA